MEVPVESRMKTTTANPVESRFLLSRTRADASPSNGGLQVTAIGSIESVRALLASSATHAVADAHTDLAHQSDYLEAPHTAAGGITTRGWILGCNAVEPHSRNTLGHRAACG